MQSVKAGFERLGEIFKRGNKAEDTDSDQESGSEGELIKEAKEPSCLTKLSTRKPKKTDKIVETKKEEVLDPVSEAMQDKVKKYVGKLSVNMPAVQQAIQAASTDNPACFAAPKAQTDSPDAETVTAVAYACSEVAVKSAEGLLKEFKLEDVLGELNGETGPGCAAQLEQLIAEQLKKTPKMEGLNHEAMAKDIMESLVAYGSVCHAAVLAGSLNGQVESVHTPAEVCVQLGLAQQRVRSCITAAQSPNRMAELTARWVPRMDASRRKIEEDDSFISALVQERVRKEAARKSKKRDISFDGSRQEAPQKTDLQSSQQPNPTKKNPVEKENLDDEFNDAKEDVDEVEKRNRALDATSSEKNPPESTKSKLNEKSSLEDRNELSSEAELGGGQQPKDVEPQHADLSGSSSQ